MENLLLNKYKDRSPKDTVALVTEFFEKKGFKIKDGTLPIGIENNLPLLLDLDKQTIVGTNLSIIEYILSIN